jgi:hypothetical protein
MIILLCGGFLSPGRIYITILLYWTCWWSSPSLSPLSLFVLSVYFFYSFGFPLKKKKSYADESIMRYVCVGPVREIVTRSGGAALRCSTCSPVSPVISPDRNMCRNKIKYKRPELFGMFQQFHPKLFLYQRTCYPIIQLCIHFFGFSLVSMGGVYFFVKNL